MCSVQSNQKNGAVQPLRAMTTSPAVARTWSNLPPGRDVGCHVVPSSSETKTPFKVAA
jgi:hypothetical protein